MWRDFNSGYCANYGEKCQWLYLPYAHSGLLARNKELHFNELKTPGMTSAMIVFYKQLIKWKLNKPRS
jgi:hypothetical protein